jgi:hypothetical protein
VLGLVQVLDDDGAALERHGRNLTYSLFIRLSNYGALTREMTPSAASNGFRSENAKPSLFRPKGMDFDLTMIYSGFRPDYYFVSIFRPTRGVFDRGP